MIKDYPDSVPAPAPTTSTLSRPSSSSPSTPTSPYFPRSPGAHLPPASRLPSLPLPRAASQASSVTPVTPSARSQFRINPLGSSTPPPRHPGGTGFTSTSSANVSPAPQTTYTPYIPRSKRNMVPPPVSAPLTPMSVPSTPPSTYRDSHNSLGNASDVPTFTSSRTGGITTRHPVSPVVTGGNFATAVNGSSSRFRRASSDTISLGGVGTLDGHSAALLDKVRSLDTLPRLGALQTLDLRGNDLRVSVSWRLGPLKQCD
jgi:protein phosphatase 1 regulatory subunit 37